MVPCRKKCVFMYKKTYWPICQYRYPPRKSGIGWTLFYNESISQQQRRRREPLQLAGWQQDLFSWQGVRPLGASRRPICAQIACVQQPSYVSACKIVPIGAFCTVTLMRLLCKCVSINIYRKTGNSSVGGQVKTAALISLHLMRQQWGNAVTVQYKTFSPCNSNPSKHLPQKGHLKVISTAVWKKKIILLVILSGMM